MGRSQRPQRVQRVGKPLEVRLLFPVMVSIILKNKPEATKYFNVLNQGNWDWFEHPDAHWTKNCIRSKGLRRSGRPWHIEVWERKLSNTSPSIISLIRLNVTGKTMGKGKGRGKEEEKDKERSIDNFAGKTGGMGQEIM